MPILAVVKNTSGRDIVIASATLSFSEREVFKHKAEFGIVSMTIIRIKDSATN